MLNKNQLFREVHYTFSAILSLIFDEENHAESLKTQVQFTEMTVTSKMG